MLTEIGFQIELHEKHFRHDEADTVLLRKCAERGWIILSADKDFHNRYADVIKNLSVGVIVLSTNSIKAQEWAQHIRTHLSSLLRIIRKTPMPWVVHLSRAGIEKTKEFRPLRKGPSRQDTGANTQTNGKAGHRR